jgi:hypothetical protein
MNSGHDYCQAARTIKSRNHEAICLERAMPLSRQAHLSPMIDRDSRSACWDSAFQAPSMIADFKN